MEPIVVEQFLTVLIDRQSLIVWAIVGRKGQNGLQSCLDDFLERTYVAEEPVAAVVGGSLVNEGIYW